MKLVQKIKNIIKILDRYSPYPLFYKIEMSKRERMFFDRSINKSKNYLEFGLGGSTIRALQKSQANIYTVELSQEWIDYMRQYVILRYFENKRFFLFPLDIGPTREWGYLRSDNFKNLFDCCFSNVLESINTNTLDLALIDGRFRIACTLKIILKCYKNNNFKILIHDFWNRKHYHGVLKYLDVIDKVDTIGFFSIKQNISIKSVAKDYSVYKVDQR